MNPFDKASQIERFKLKQLADFLNVDMFPGGMRAPYDALFMKNSIVCIEAKVRKEKSTSYDSCILEENKYKKLKKLIDENIFDKALYVMFWSDNVAIVYNIMKINPEWVSLPMKKTTVADNGIVEKKMCFLPFSQGTMINLNK